MLRAFNPCLALNLDCAPSGDILKQIVNPGAAVDLVAVNRGTSRFILSFGNETSNRPSAIG